MEGALSCQHRKYLYRQNEVTGEPTLLPPQHETVSFLNPAHLSPHTQTRTHTLIPHTHTHTHAP